MFSKLVLTALPFLARGASPVISVFGHKNPDTDAISAAMTYAWFLKEQGHDATAYRLDGAINPETKYVLSTLGVEEPPLFKGTEPKMTVAIVDTNNPEELPSGLDKVKIQSLVDHHKLSGLTNAEPTEIDIRPLCSAGSIVYAKAKEVGLTPPKHIAGLMLSSILSDSLEFRSPTTTAIDKVYAAELAKLAGLDAHKHAEAMLDAKAQIDHLSPKELLMMDSKIFKIGGKKLRVSVLETTKPASPLAKQAALVEAQKALAVEEGLDDVLLFIVDILNESATFVSSSPTATKTVEKAWKVTVDEQGLVLLPGVLSRKKQMIPALEEAAKTETVV